VDEKNAIAGNKTNVVVATEPWFEDVSSLLNHSHVDDFYDDWQRQPLLPYRLSQLGPGISWQDFNGDGWADIIVPSGRGGKMAFFQNNRRGGFTNVAEPMVARPLGRDQTAVLGIGPSLLFAGSANYEDGRTNGGAIRVYDLQRKVAGESLLGPSSSTGPLALADVNGDGALDLFIGGRAVAGHYPEAANSMLYRNEGNRFVPQQRFEKLGLVSGAVFTDLDLDGDPDLVLACHWGPIRVFRNEKGKLVEVTAELGLDKYTGLWNGVATGDFDNDGLPDLIASNWGLNSRWRASANAPLKIYYGDLDGDGITDVIETSYDSELKKEVPLRTFKYMGAALPFVKERIKSFAEYGRASVQEIFGERLKSAAALEVTTLSSMVFLNRGDHFEARELPMDAQISTGFGVSVGDLDGDGNEDVFISQNFSGTNVEMPRNDGGVGVILKGDGHGNFRAVPVTESGIHLYGEGRGCALADYDHDGRLDLVVAENGAATRLFRNRRANPGMRVIIKGPESNPWGIGSSLRVANGPRREIQSGSGYWSQNAPEILLNERGVQAQLRVPGKQEMAVSVPPKAKAIEIDFNGAVRIVDP
jgi:hypothetical protein